MINLDGQIDELNKNVEFDDDEQGLETSRQEKVEHTDEEKTDENFVKNPFDVDEPIDEEVVQTNTKSAGENKIIEDLLKQKGITDQGKILYEDENGEVIEKNFYELPYEDQLNILSQEEDAGFSEEELYYLQQARENNISLTELIKYYQNQALEQQQQSQNDYTVSSYTDEELYVLDMKAKFGDDVTDDEILGQLEKELELPELFKKKVDKLRQDYIALEQEEKAKTIESQKQEQHEQFAQFTENITQLVDNVEDVGGVVLEDNDKNEILSFMLQQDINGATEFQKQMNDPENVFLAAWAILKAKDTFDVLKEHYEGQLKNLKKQTTPSKKDLGTQRPVVVRSAQAQKKHVSIDDLHTFDD